MTRIEQLKVAYYSYLRASGDAAQNGDKSISEYYFLQAQEAAEMIVKEMERCRED